MEHCAIYSHQLNFDRVVEIVRRHLPKADIEHINNDKQKCLTAIIKGGFFAKNKTLKINYRERANPSYTLEQIECDLSQNLAGMVGFIQKIQAQNKAIQNKLMIKVMAANTEMPFMAEPNITPVFSDILKEITTSFDAFVFAAPSPYFSQSTSQQFLDESLNLILDDQGLSKVEDLNVQVDAKYLDGPSADYTQEQLDRKTKSETFLRDHGIKINTHLPCMPAAENTRLRTKKEIVDRAYALMIIALRGEGVSSEEIKRPISEKNIDSFTPKELSIVHNSSLSDEQRSYATWRYESLYTLLWALNIMPNLKYPSDICDVPAIVSALIKPSPSDFLSQCTLRSSDEILTELDKTYRMHWACVDARINGQAIAGNINPSVIYERHYALNWLSHYQDQDWDNVQTNT